MVSVGVFAVVMGILAGALAVRRENLWPVAIALVGCAIGLGLAVR